MKILLENKTKIHDIEIKFSISCLKPKENGVYHLITIVHKQDIRLINHKEEFMKGSRTNRITKEKLIERFELNRPIYIKQLLEAIETYENRRTQRTGNN